MVIGNDAERYSVIFLGTNPRGEEYHEKVGKGYIIFSKALSEVEVVELYDNNGLLQSDINDLLRYGSVFNEVSFVDIQ